MFWRSLWFERFAPAVLAFAVLCAIVIWRTAISSQFANNGWKPENLYSAVFNWASIQSGFVFGIYGFIATKKDGFAGMIGGGASFKMLLTYTRRAYMTGFGLTFTSLPMLVASPSIAVTSTLTFWIVAIWFSCFVWTFLAFLRVAFIFGMIVATPDKPYEITG